MKSILLLLLILCCLTCQAQRKEYLLEGTIGKYPIVLQLSSSRQDIYYYRSSKKSIELDGRIDNGVYTMYKSLRVPPAMEAKLTTKPMTIEDIVNLVPIEAPRKEGLTKGKTTTPNGCDCSLFII